ncbi:MAG TPA: SMC-Scp complex subunit ScpB [Verrucomicrobiales bacterium]|nr:SMC-Scp complex subunit ScpB [Verrucomicrobiales bacterium]
MEVDWNQWEPRERSVLVFVRKDDQVLLIRKKRGFGAGKVNAPGGKIDEGESPLEAALREAEEEAGIVPLEPAPVGELFFQFTDGLSIHCTVFLAKGCRGKARETDEAAPFWKRIGAIPYEEMWEDDRHWLPGMLEGQRFKGYFIFDGDVMLTKEVTFEGGPPERTEDPNEEEESAWDDKTAGKRAVDRLVAELCPIVEALLIASKSPLTSRTLARIVRQVAVEQKLPKPSLLPKTGGRHIERAIAELNREYEQERRAFMIVERAAGWKIYTVSKYAVWVRAIYPEQKPPRLSGPALETLAIIAYRQPVTRADIESVRGVNVDAVMKMLLDRSLVRIAGRADLPGRPLLYETTSLFLDHFGIRSVDELPNAAELRRAPLPVADLAAADDRGEEDES